MSYSDFVSWLKERFIVHEMSDSLFAYIGSFTIYVVGSLIDNEIKSIAWFDSGGMNGKWKQYGYQKIPFDIIFPCLSSDIQTELIFNLDIFKNSVQPK